MQRALELYALSSRYPFVANSRYLEDAAGRHMAALAATWPPDAVAAIRAHGRARDLEATVAELVTQLEAAPEGEQLALGEHIMGRSCESGCPLRRWPDAAIS